MLTGAYAAKYNKVITIASQVPTHRHKTLAAQPKTVARFTVFLARDRAITHVFTACFLAD